MGNSNSWPIPHSLTDEAKDWRNRGEEVRALAGSMDDAKSRLIMLRIAGDYERLAQRAEQRVKVRRYDQGLPN
jgi:hypothetical protein